MDEYKQTMLDGTLRETVSNIAPDVLHAEILKYVPTESMKILQSLGIREEGLFALPCVLKQNPKLLGYYRLMLGISEKQFYKVNSATSKFRTMERDGDRSRVSDEDLSDLCRALNEATNSFVKHSNQKNLPDDVSDLPILTLGVYADGVW